MRHTLSVMSMSALLLAAVGSRVIAGPLTMRLETADGSVLEVVDDGPNDLLNTTADSVSFQGSLPGFSFVSMTALSYSGTSAQPYISLSGLVIADENGASLQVFASQTGFGLSSDRNDISVISGIGLTTDGSAIFQSYLDSKNSLYGTTGKFVCTPGLHGPFTGTGDSQLEATCKHTNTFSITAEHVIFLDAGELHSFGAIVSAEHLFTSGRMTGGGSVFMEDGRRVTHGFEIHCDLRPPNNLQINWKDVDGNEIKFHLEELTGAICIDTAIDQLPRTAPFDTFVGGGNGRVNNVSGYSIRFIFTDAGEPGRDDIAIIEILDPDGNEVLFVANQLTFGNHQAHKDNRGRPSSANDIADLIAFYEANTDPSTTPFVLDFDLFLSEIFSIDASRVRSWWSRF